ncbi:MAG TPA: 5-deoxy-glucuronate isomerase [Solirubrobacter sp.]|nr:5-deoxy-glucuronate isomerase [Solirubrobacter sp.]
MIRVTPESAGWTYVGFEALQLGSDDVVERTTGARELCVVVIAGRAQVGPWTLGSRPTPFEGAPDAAYFPPGSTVRLAGEAELGLCWAPAERGAAARALPAAEIVPQTRGTGATERTIHDILMPDRAAERLLVTEVQTPGGHWSSWPPHRHERDDPPHESLLEETYYHRLDPPGGFAIQRVYTDDRSLDRVHAVRDGDVVLVPRGYHPVGAVPGVRSYYLNVMAGPRREWHVRVDPDFSRPPG